VLAARVTVVVVIEVVSLSLVEPHRRRVFDPDDGRDGLSDRGGRSS
jgi:hypothetical protein